MTSIQLTLVTLFGVASVFSSSVFRSKLGLRLLTIVFLIAAIGFVMFPDSTTSIAHLLGVGRGTDLLVYLALAAGVNVFLALYLRTRKLEQKLTQHIRATAIKQARAPESLLLLPVKTDDLEM